MSGAEKAGYEEEDSGCFCGLQSQGPGRGLYS